MNELIIDYSLYAQMSENDGIFTSLRLPKEICFETITNGNWALNEVKINVSYKNIQFPFLYYKVNEVDNSISCAFYTMKEDKYIQWCIHLKISDEGIDFDYSTSKEDREYFVYENGELKPKMQKILFISVNFFIYFQFKILMLNTEHNHSKIEKKQMEERKSGNRSTNNYACTSSKPIKIADRIIWHYQQEENKTYQRHIESWSVRGHYRHYKSGKIVFIKEFKKGSGTINERKYLL